MSFAPFLVVHINPAYTRMTGLTPADILGKPFHEVIEDPSIKASTAKAAAPASKDWWETENDAPSKPAAPTKYSTKDLSKPAVAKESAAAAASSDKDWWEV